MFFTKEDYEKIAGYLKAAGVRDTDIQQLNQAQHPLTGEETFVLVKDGVNVRVTLNDIYAQFPQLAELIIEAQQDTTIGVFNVSQYGTNAGAFASLTQAIEAVPEAIRKPGLYITYYDEAYHWHTYQMIGQSIEEEWDAEYFIDYHEDLQDKLDAINNSNAKVTLTSSKNIIYARGSESTRTIRLTLHSTIPADILEIRQGNTVLNSDTVEQEDLYHDIIMNNTTTYTGVANIKGITKTANITVYVVDYISYGAMIDYNSTSMTHFDSLVTTPEQTYTINIPEGGGYIYLYIPSNVRSGSYNLQMQLISGSFETAVDMGVVPDYSNNEGKLWKSTSLYDPGTFQFKATITNN